MESTATASSPLLRPDPVPLGSQPQQTSPKHPRLKQPRTVTFNANPVTKTIDFDPGPTLKPTVSSPSTAVAGSAPPMLASLNSKLHRRNSHGALPHAFAGGPAGAAGVVGNTGLGAGGNAGPKIGPQRSSKNAQKLKLLPNPEVAAAMGEESSALGMGVGDDDDDEAGRNDVYSQLARIEDPRARRDARRLGKADRARLPRVTAYCTANKYQMDGLMRFLKGRGRLRGANPKLFDECMYTPFSYGSTKTRADDEPVQTGNHGSRHAQKRQEREVAIQEEAATTRSDPVTTYERRHSTGGEAADGSEAAFDRGDLIDLGAGAQPSEAKPTWLPGKPSSRSPLAPGLQDTDSTTVLSDDMADLDVQVHTPEVFLFDYGVVVIWGMSPSQEQRFLQEIAKFEAEKLAPDDVETEHFNFYYTREYQPRIYNDFITLRDRANYMTKLAISHALAQSVKTSLFEELIASTIDTCKDIPTQIALTGKIALSRTQINMQIGELFILRINIHLNGSVLDTPELFWVEPQLEPVYQAVRSYLEMDQRVELLTNRLDVIADLLAVLKDQLSHGHGEKLEWIVIVLIAAEIVVAAVNIVVDLYAGVD